MRLLLPALKLAVSMRLTSDQENAETLTLGKRLTHRVIALNQGIESFNATLEKVESFRVTHAATLSRTHAIAARRRSELPRSGKNRCGKRS